MGGLQRGHIPKNHTSTSEVFNALKGSMNLSAGDVVGAGCTDTCWEMTGSSEKWQELWENRTLALFHCAASAGRWLHFQWDCEYQVWSWDLGLVGVQKTDHECVSLWDGKHWAISWKTGVEEGLFGYFNLKIAHRYQNFTAGQVKHNGNTPRQNVLCNGCYSTCTTSPLAFSHVRSCQLIFTPFCPAEGRSNSNCPEVTEETLGSHKL